VCVFPEFGGCGGLDAAQVVFGPLADALRDLCIFPGELASVTVDSLGNQICSFDLEHSGRLGVFTSFAELEQSN
jgi:hypothetical protein